MGCDQILSTNLFCQKRVKDQNLDTELPTTRADPENVRMGSLYQTLTI